MTTDNEYEIKQAVKALRRRHTIDELREAFKDRTLDSTFSYIGRLAVDRFLDEHFYIWEGYAIVIGYKYAVYDVPLTFSPEQ